MKVQNLHLRKMGKSAIIALFITFLALAIPAHADVDDVIITDSLSRDQSMIESITLVVKNVTNTKFRFTVPPEAEIIKASGSPNEIINNTITYNLSCDICQLDLSYKLGDTVRKESKDYFIYSRTLGFPYDPKRLIYKIVLPEGHWLHSETEEPTVVPSGAEIGTNGKRIIITWDTVNPQLPNRYFVSYTYNEFTGGLYTDFKSELLEWQVWVIAVTFLMIGIVAGFFASRLIPNKEMPKEVIPPSILAPDEKTIMRLLSENDGKMLQKEIGRKLNWSKSKVSSIMTNLEYKGIISREKSGRNYRITVLMDIGD